MSNDEIRVLSLAYMDDTSRDLDVILDDLALAVHMAVLDETGHEMAGVVNTHVAVAADQIKVEITNPFRCALMRALGEMIEAKMEGAFE